MGERGEQIVSGVNHIGAEEATFPIVCETCLGDNPYVRMQKEPMGDECKICERPYTMFRWKAGSKGRYKQTVLCQNCARMKNVCQVCIFDLDFGLPVQVRDKFLSEAEKLSLPESTVGRDYQALNNSQNANPALTYGKLKHHPMLQKLARTAPYYERNQARICSFFVKGTCNRGDECPYRHEMPKPEGNDLNDQNIRDRYHGTDDPVAKKILKQAAEKFQLEAPEDTSITTLYIGGIDPNAQIGESNIRAEFEEFGQIDSIVLVEKSNCAFVEFTGRQSAEKAAAEKGGSNLVINGARLRVSWAKPKSGGLSAGSSALVKAAAEGSAVKQTVLAPAGSGVYPSMNPMVHGNAPIPQATPEQRARQEKQ
ncbi:pre-mRNA-splicing factor SLT11, putative [Perkinsus marinus ATCC 50983]|uniref:Pre-mRNA-splicing factor SLT11, putative n=1 Tax=Perkinsus marinus (strain ATCC 50983 / TXsc) TaxID=423536 RepID=C5KJD7_PERM5|nr:pre-mRNA-splicing factor SLT11, putative [Perkinsus marinus ATCC 50983]EER15439.1 pre-mRNA-splicing factor SLT11, putative [Perkinsus marinus ATCC 50983]|eukprot:XP_002783643.1 pre-mRNA-splicing factor SLT11, putative [Perkinsus marinus ATCC 50983]